MDVLIQLMPNQIALNSVQTVLITPQEEKTVMTRMKLIMTDAHLSARLRLDTSVITMLREQKTLATKFVAMERLTITRQEKIVTMEIQTAMTAALVLAKLKLAMNAQTQVLVILPTTLPFVLKNAETEFIASQMAKNAMTKTTMTMMDAIRLAK